MDPYDLVTLYRDLYEKNKNADRETYERNKREAIKQRLDNKDSRWRANKFDDLAKDREERVRDGKYRDFEHLRNIEFEAEYWRGQSKSTSAAAETAKHIADWYENHSFDWIQREKQDEEFNERQRRQNEARKSERSEEETFNNEDLGAVITDFTRSLDLINKCAAKDKRYEAAASVEYCRRGDAYYMQGEYDKAIADLSKAIDLAPDNINAYLSRARAYRDNQNPEMAITDMSRVIKLDRNHAEAYFLRGTIYIRIGNLGNALADYETACKLDPSNNVYAEMLAAVMEAVSNERQQRVRKNEPREEVDFFGNIEEMFRPSKEYSEGLKKMGIQIQEKKPVMSIAERLERAKAYCDDGDYDRAIEEYNEILDSDPDNVDARFGRGAVCSGYGDNYDQAIADLGYVIQSYPDNAMAYYFRACAHSNKGASLKALADYNRAIQLEPNIADMYFSRSVVYFNIEKYDRAISDCDQAIRLDPRHVRSYIGRGVIYYDKKGECKRAIEDFEAALRIDRNNALATQWLEKARRNM
jgi:tetratricopeptide (TPR) repeat protein